MVRLLLAGEHVLLLEGLKRLLEEQEAAEVRTLLLEAAPELPQDWVPDVLLVETSDVRGIGPQLARLRAHVAPAPLLIIAPGEPEQFLAALRAGARGFVPRDARAGNLMRCVAAVRRGEWGLPRGLLGALVDAYLALAAAPAPTDPQLTERERQVLQLLVRGWSAERIGRELFLSESGVRSVIRGIARKLGVQRTTEVVRIAVQQRLVPMD
jgi:DNA-binding NarL/FixJ family response regulator